MRTLMQLYDPLMICFTFQNYQLASTLEEYSYIMGVEIKHQVPFININELPKFHHIAEALNLEKKEVVLNLKLKGGILGFTLMFQGTKPLLLLMLGAGMPSMLFFIYLYMGQCCFLTFKTLWT